MSGNIVLGIVFLIFERLLSVKWHGRLRLRSSPSLLWALVMGLPTRLLRLRLRRLLWPGLLWPGLLWRCILLAPRLRRRFLTPWLLRL